MKANPALAYRQLAARTATPVGLVVLLYDAALISLHRASRAIESGDIEQRTRCLNHVQEVIGQLQGTLDFKRGGEVAHRLEHFYNLARGKVLEAGFKTSREILQGLAEQFLSLRDAWEQVERSLSSPPPATPAAPPDAHWSA